MRCEACHKDAPEDAVFCPYCAGRLRGGGEGPKPFAYAAFISYRHLPRDQEVAKRVQRAIETYRLPRDASPELKGGRLGKCFRDEDELAATHSLPERIIDALSKSSSLVVVCTPDTAESVWVRREVEAFVEMRGRERVFAVLAAGSSAQSIPDYLKASGPSIGDEAPASSSPLAADMRPEASGKTREEELRLIAAIAGCGFDDLKQRDRVRRRKRFAVAVAAAMVVVAAIAAALAFAFAASQDALVANQDALAAESRKLAAESEQLLSQGDRYGALEKALEALPESESSNDRPYIPEARTALEDALQIEFDPDRLWIPLYSIDAGSNNAKLVVNYDRGWFALLKVDMTVDFHETLTGKRLSSVDLREEMVDGGRYLVDDLDQWTLLPAGDYLVVAERAGNFTSFCLEAATGKATWAQDLMIDAIAVSPDDSAATVFCNAPNAGFAAAYGIPNGEWSGRVEFENAEIPDVAGILPSVTGEDLYSMYVGFNDAVGKFDLATGESVISDSFGESLVLSLARADNAIIATVCLTDGIPDDYGDLQEPASAQCVVAALDNDTLQPLWENGLRWVPKSYFLDTGYVSLNDRPHPVDFGSFGEPAIICVAGSLVQVYAVSDGALIYEYDFPEAVVGAQSYSKHDGFDYLNVACVDGVVYFSAPARGRYAPTPVSFSYPGPVSESQTFWNQDADILSIARSLENPERYFVYRTEYRTAETAKSASDYTLDELIEMAHAQLDAVAQ